MDKHVFIAGAVVLTIAFIFGLRFLTPEDTWICRNSQWIRHGNPSAPAPETGCPPEAQISANPTTTLTAGTTETPSPSSTREYKNSKMGISLQYPEDMEITSNEDGSISVSKWGPTQKENTELFDGITINISQASLGTNTDLLSLINADIEQKREQLSPDYKILESPTPYTLWYKTGAFTYKAEEVFGSVTYFYLPQSSGKFLLISTHYPDPQNTGFELQAEKIVRSIKVDL